MNTEEIIKLLEALRDAASKETESLSNHGYYQESEISYAAEIAYEYALEIIKKHTEVKK